MSEINWTVILQFVIAGGIAWILKGVSTINGSIKALNVWKVQHEKQDAERHETLKEEARDQRIAINHLRDR